VTCEQFEGGLVTDHMENALPAGIREAVHRHISGCERCTELLERMQSVVARVWETLEIPLDDRTRSRILAACSPALAQRRSRRSRAPG